jgi:hypothetical protein
MVSDKCTCRSLQAKTLIACEVDDQAPNVGLRS